MKTVHQMLRFALAIALLGSSPVVADPPVYENFKGKVLNSGRWYGDRVEPGVVEIRRKILKKNSIHLRLRGVADVAQTTGERHKVVNRIWMDSNRSREVRSFQTYVQVNNAQVVDCTDDAAVDSRSAYQNINTWFNNGLSSGLADQTGDIYTQMSLLQSSASQQSSDELSIVAFVGQCLDNDCDASASLFHQTLGVYPIGSRIVVRTTWDDLDKEFRFYARQQGLTPLTVSFDYAAVADDGNRPGQITKRLHGISVRTDVADCHLAASGGERPYGYIDTRVFNARVADTPTGF